MNGYVLALFGHLLSLLLACVATSLSTFAALRLRDTDSPREAMSWIAFTERVVLAFPVSALGLLGTGVYMTHVRWAFSISWIDAAMAGLVMIVALGKGVEGGRSRALKRELESSGMSPRARRLLRDPLAWSAKMTTLTLFVAVVFVMAAKPAAAECVAALCTAVVVGLLTAIPFWWSAAVASPELTGPGVGNSVGHATGSWTSPSRGPSLHPGPHPPRST
ncbi:MAG: hypothetical protein LJF06_07645 [Gemmatimonadetes bacterium]|nr:hypothetical protein [Gemmatimonadota bacterium]